MRALNDSSLRATLIVQAVAAHRQTGPTDVPKEFIARSAGLWTLVAATRDRSLCQRALVPYEQQGSIPRA